MTRWVSFRFDDGLIGSARKVVEILKPDAASFFVIAGFIDPALAAGRRKALEGGDYGSLDAWRALHAQGQDVQPHSVTHPNFQQISVPAQGRELRESLAFVRRLHPGPYVFCFPFNAISDLDLAAEGYAGAGFETHGSNRPALFNPLSPNVYRLKSWAVRERHYDFVAEQLAAVPDQTWTILGFHGLDGEGWEPWTREAFARLVAFVRAAGYRVVTVREGVAAASGS